MKVFMRWLYIEKNSFFILLFTAVSCLFVSKSNAEPQEVEKMELCGACFDIDGTLTTHVMGYHPVGYFEFILAGMLCRKGCLPVNALERVSLVENTVAEANPFLAAEHLGLNCAEYREELMRYQEKYLDRHQDTLRLLAFLTDRGIPVFITTNNTKARAETVLEFPGIRRKIRKIYTPQITGARKKSPDFWMYVISDTGIASKNLVVIGDEEISDSQVPLHAGFGMSCLLPEKREREKLPAGWLVQKVKAGCILRESATKNPDSRKFSRNRRPVPAVPGETGYSAE